MPNYEFSGGLPWHIREELERCWKSVRLNYDNRCAKPVDLDDDLGLCTDHVAMLREERDLCLTS